jgi:hypothetical protein
MMELTGILCQSLSECRAVLDDLDGGSISSEEALARIKAELARQELLRAMWEVGAFPAHHRLGVVGDH